jgi:2,4-dienoyl-CoA reductase (NADPH2)
MKKPAYPTLFKSKSIDGLRLKNRITMAEAILRDNKADLIGLARMLWVDPHWPQKARRGDDRKILKCNSKCDACIHLVMKGQPAICPRWPKEKRTAYRELFH